MGRALLLRLLMALPTLTVVGVHLHMLLHTRQRHIRRLKTGHLFPAPSVPPAQWQRLTGPCALWAVMAYARSICCSALLPGRTTRVCFPSDSVTLSPETAVTVQTLLANTRVPCHSCETHPVTGPPG
ncbi:hypothetical protein EZ880_24320 (plasmid) [Salmonella enterica subsp. enterica serovar 4,12:i:-]|uniref:hypothetical protein n=1 Tax=Salmonella enterica TaxID=28901 RepID=UPI0027D31088|nr:hypothetical protein [Salmonella enterica]WMC28623.1 hypothetical protein EZ880_24320 [Salmonella enterica subsp. enterica serovar 4,12:i:-]